jgi:hypothetical protein
MLSALTVVTIGAVLPVTPLARVLGFQALPVGFFAALVALVVAYLALVEVANRPSIAARSCRGPHDRRPAGATRINATFGTGPPTSTCAAGAGTSSVRRADGLVVIAPIPVQASSTS